MMHIRSAFQALLIAIAFTVCGGCMGPMPTGQHAQLAPSAPLNTQSAFDAEIQRLKSAANSAPATSPGQPTSPGKTTEPTMAEILNELEGLGAIDPVAKQELITDLQNAKPENWSMIVQNYQMALAYQKQLAARESQTPENDPYAFPKPTSPSVTKNSYETSKKPTALDTSLQTKTEPAASTIVVSDNVPPGQVSTSDAAMKAARPLPKPVISTRHQATAVAAPTHHTIEQVSYEAPIAQAGNWQAHLQSAITKLESTVEESPSSTDEVHDHMRLRMLRMLVGEEEDALLPIPGASSLQQDYWAKQLFAVSIFLDNQSQPDGKRRAAGSLLQLDQARANLSEIATLQVRNLTFVESVDGYGVYKPRADTKFRSGDQVTLYTEVDNFRSESTKEGHRTILGTSYEVLDDRGQRVDSAQFPDVEDLCRNRRHDFHMQYGVALPTRIYAGEYQLRITVTDQISHKISQASVSFQIVD